MNKIRSRKYISLIFVLLLSLTLAACSEKINVVGKVGDVEISEDELNDVLVKKYGAETLNQLIRETIIQKEADKADIKVTDEEVEKEYEDMAMQYNGVEGLKAAMAQANVKEEDLRKDIKTNLSLEKLLESEINITDEEVSAYYEENKERFKQGEQVNASHILVEGEDEAKDIVKKLEAGEDFAKLAKQHSIDEGTKEKGGELGFFGRGQMVPEFDKAAFELKENDISQPIKSDFGYHIIVVHEKKAETVTSLEENKEQIKDVLKEDRMPEVFNQWNSEKMKEYQVENKLTDNKEADK